MPNTLVETDSRAGTIAFILSLVTVSGMLVTAALLSTYTGPELLGRKAVLALGVTCVIGLASLAFGFYAITSPGPQRLGVAGLLVTVAALPVAAIADVIVLGALSAAGIYW